MFVDRENTMNELLDDDLLALLLDEAADDMHARSNRRRLDRAPLSFAQQRLWLEQQRDRTDLPTTCHVPCA